MPLLAERKLDDLVTAVLAAGKYQHISPDVVRRIGRGELAKRPRLKEAVKATKNKLHQIGGAYFAAAIDYEAALARLGEAQRGDTEAQRAALCSIMQLHASTRERLPILDRFYAETLAGLPPIGSVLDVACGLNPLAWLWMPFGPETRYTAVDIYTDMMAFLSEYMVLAGINGRALAGDFVTTETITGPLTEPVDLVLLLKTLPVLAQADKTAVPRLLDSLQAGYLLVSFPAKSLGGRSKGMAQNYEAQFEGWISGRGWNVKKFDFENELAFLVETGKLIQRR